MDIAPTRTRVESIPEGACPESVELVLGNSVYVPKAGLPEDMLNQVIRLAAFQNPEFYKPKRCACPRGISRGSFPAPRNSLTTSHCRAVASRRSRSF
jgi:hypothetical protein